MKTRTVFLLALGMAGCGPAAVIIYAGFAGGIGCGIGAACTSAAIAKIQATSTAVSTTSAAPVVSPATIYGEYHEDHWSCCWRDPAALEHPVLAGEDKMPLNLKP